MSEIADVALILLPIAGALVLAILSSRLSDRLPVPAPGIFLLVAAAAARLLLAIGGRVRLASEELRPVLLIALAMSLYAVAAMLGGSGFLAVFVAGLVLGDAEIPGKVEVERFNRSLAGLAEIVVFVALGLTVKLAELPAAIWRDGAVLALLLAFVVRPLVVAVVLTRARLEPGDRAFITWSGLKGAVPILLAAFAVLGDVPGAATIYGVVRRGAVLGPRPGQPGPHDGTAPAARCGPSGG